MLGGGDKCYYKTVDAVHNCSDHIICSYLSLYISNIYMHMHSI